MYTIESLRLNRVLEIAIVPSKKELFSRLSAKRVIYSSEANFNNKIPDKNLTKSDILELGASLVAADIESYAKDEK